MAAAVANNDLTGIKGLDLKQLEQGDAGLRAGSEGVRQTTVGRMGDKSLETRQENQRLLQLIPSSNMKLA